MAAQPAGHVRARTWMAAYVAAVLVTAGLSVVGVSRPDLAATLLDRPAAWSAGVVVAAIIHLARRPADNTPRTVGWTLRLAILAVVVLAVRMSSLLDAALLGTAAEDHLVAVWLIEAAAVAAVGLALARKAPFPDSPWPDIGRRSGW